MKIAIKLQDACGDLQRFNPIKFIGLKFVRYKEDLIQYSEKCFGNQQGSRNWVMANNKMIGKSAATSSCSIILKGLHACLSFSVPQSFQDRVFEWIEIKLCKSSSILGLLE